MEASPPPLLPLEEDAGLSIFASLVVGLLHLLCLPLRLLWLLLLAPLLRLLFGQRPLQPSPSRVLEEAPAAVFLSEATQAYAAKKLGRDIPALNEKVVRAVNATLRSGRQLGLVVVAYYKGYEVVHVGGGLCRSQHGPHEPWRPVGPSTLFTCMSVTKGICATGVLKLVENGVISYDEPVTHYWPGFASGSRSDRESQDREAKKATLTVAEALSHRAGLTEAGGNVALVLIRNMLTYGRCGLRWQVPWGASVEAVERHRPEWAPGAFAAYHPVAFSWILGGLVDHACTAAAAAAAGDEAKLAAAAVSPPVPPPPPPPSSSTSSSSSSTAAEGKGSSWKGGSGGGGGGKSGDGGSLLQGHILPVLRELVAAPLHIPPAEVFIGRFPISEDRRLARIETMDIGALAALRRPPGIAKAAGPLHCVGGLVRWLELHVAAAAEGPFLAWFCGLPWFRRVCLPSSNGQCTARAVGRIFGALANGGAVLTSFDFGGVAGGGVAGGGAKKEAGEVGTNERFVEEETVRLVRDRIKTSNEGPALPNQHPDGQYPDIRARLSCGFFPWACPDLHGKAGAEGTVLNHEGMGGSMVYADAESGLAVCVLKNVYEPLSALSGSISPDACEIAAQIRAEFGVE